MTARLRPYDSDRDFIPVRDLLVEAYGGFPDPVNWRLERWNYARHFCAPMIGPTPETRSPTEEESLLAIRMWESRIGVWEDAEGRVAGVVTNEYPWPATAYLQRRPGHDELLDDMLAYAERVYRVEKTNAASTFIYEDDEPLVAAALARGYVRDDAVFEPDLEYRTDGALPEARMPSGYRFVSMAESDDIEERRKIFGLSFRHPDPLDWPTAFSYRELQRAPDYRPELDLVVEAPDGTYVSCCILWHDEVNRIGMLEPVGSIRLGYGREVVMEAVRRAAALGIEKVIMESGLRFYRSIGFRPTGRMTHRWTRALSARAGRAAAHRHCSRRRAT